LVVTGDEDILVHPRNANRLTDGLRAELIVLPGAGHGANEQVCYCSISGQLTPCNNKKKNRSTRARSTRPLKGKY